MFDFWILWINARNLHYIGKYNPEKAVRLADNKIHSKEFLSERGIPVATTYAVINDRSELIAFDFSEIPHQQFIIKPARGSRGRGIFRVQKMKDYTPESPLLSPKTWRNHFWGQDHAENHDEGRDYFRVGGSIISEWLLKNYCLDILEGKQSLQGKPDQILIEELLLPGDWFVDFCDFWLADIRMIVYNFVPVAAMLRVPTQKSDGKANLDRGGVGLGVEVGSGKVISMYLEGKSYTSSFPEPYHSFHDKIIPYREEMLEWSSQIQYYVNLGYLALDRVITTEWPKLLEINARAWLKIQLALQLPLRQRLEKVGDLKLSSPEKWVEICQTLFTHQKTGLVSPNKILAQTGFGAIQRYAGWELYQYDVTVEIDLVQTGLYVDPLLYKKLDIVSELSVSYGSQYTKFHCKKRKVDKELANYHIILWVDIVEKYLIKPVKELKTKKTLFPSHVLLPQDYEIFRLLDNKLAQVSAKLIFSRYLKPTNFLQELDTFVSRDGEYDPVFSYQRPKRSKLQWIQDALEHIQEEFRQEVHIESPLLALFEEKLEELLVKHRLLAAYSQQDYNLLEQLQPLYRWSYDPALAVQAETMLRLPTSDRSVLWPVLWRKRIKKTAMNYLQWLWREDIQLRFTPESYARMSVEKQGEEIILNIAAWSTFRKSELYAALAHEMVHVRRFVQAQKSPWLLLRRGTARSFVDDEGLAILAAESELPESYEKRSMRQKYLLVQQSMHKSFAELAAMLMEQDEHKSLLSVFKTVYRVKRWIQNTAVIHPWTACLQDSIYVQGYDRIRTRQAQWGDTEALMKGKIKIEDLSYF